MHPTDNAYHQDNNFNKKNIYFFTAKYSTNILNYISTVYNCFEWGQNHLKGKFENSHVCREIAIQLRDPHFMTSELHWRHNQQGIRFSLNFWSFLIFVDMWSLPFICPPSKRHTSACASLVKHSHRWRHLVCSPGGLPFLLGVNVKTIFAQSYLLKHRSRKLGFLLTIRALVILCWVPLDVELSRIKTWNQNWLKGSEGRPALASCFDYIHRLYCWM